MVDGEDFEFISFIIEIYYRERSSDTDSVGTGDTVVVSHISRHTKLVKCSIIVPVDIVAVAPSCGGNGDRGRVR